MTAPLDEAGVAAFLDVNTYPTPAATNVMRQASVNLIFAQVWSRPGLTRRERRWLSLTCAGAAGAAVGLAAHMYGALNSGEISDEEMGEFLLQIACYLGWPRATPIDASLTQTLERIATERGTDPPSREYTSLRTEDLGELLTDAAGLRAEVVGTPGPGGTPLSDLWAAGLEYGQLWSRPQLARSDRRLITIAALAIANATEMLGEHVAAALAADEFGEAALFEVSLHVACYAGIPVGRRIDDAIIAAR